MGITLQNGTPMITWQATGTDGAYVSFTLRALEPDGTACDFQTVTLRLARS
jgi:hypothetical protein